MESSLCKIVISERGKEKLPVNGYLFTLRTKRVQKTSGKETFYWGCEDRTCKRTAVTHYEDNSHILRRESEHTCGSAEASRVAVVKVRNTIKQRATETRDKPCQIIHDLCSSVDSSIVHYTGNKGALKKLVSRVRKERPVESNNLDDLSVPTE